MGPEGPSLPTPGRRATTIAAVPVEPAPTAWVFPPAARARGEVVGVGADLEPGTLLAAYRAGIFPMPVDAGHLAWWSPDPRAILPLEDLHISHSLRRAMRRYEIRFDTAFAAVVAACAGLPRPGGWIDQAIEAAYTELHRLGWAHSVEAWAGGELVGGLYGVSIGGLFAGESMFSTRPDASKAALVALVQRLADAEAGDAGAADRAGRLLDVQWATPHLRRLGAVEIRRGEYMRRLAVALTLDAPPWIAPPTPAPSPGGRTARRAASTRDAPAARRDVGPRPAG